MRTQEMKTKLDELITASKSYSKYESASTFKRHLLRAQAALEMLVYEYRKEKSKTRKPS